MRSPDTQHAVPSRRFRPIQVAAAIAVAVAACLVLLHAQTNAQTKEWRSGIPWPEVKVVDPGPVGGPPSDAIVLFDGRSMSAWEDGKNGRSRTATSRPPSSDIFTKQAFGDCQLHVEWATPEEGRRPRPGRGNSGVFLHGPLRNSGPRLLRQRHLLRRPGAAVYKQHPPLVNACRKPGEWQTYDIIFEGPRFDKQGKLLKPAFVTVLHNGVLVQNHFQIRSAELPGFENAGTTRPIREKMPLKLQYHGNPVRFRNIWIRELPPADAPPPAKA